MKIIKKPFNKKGMEETDNVLKKVGFDKDETLLNKKSQERWENNEDKAGVYN